MNKTGFFVLYYVPVILFSCWKLFVQAPYFLQPPSYNELQDVFGIVTEHPSWYANAKWKGIYIKDTNHNDGMFFCDVKKHPVITGSSRDFNQVYGQCDWLGLYQQALENKKIRIKSFNYTIYEISIENRMVYSYQEMKNIYRNKFIDKIKQLFYCFVVGIPLMVYFLDWYINKYLKHEK